jgi:hypothetical protein
VPGRDQLRDQPAAQGAGCAGEEDAHDLLPFRRVSTRETGWRQRA